MIKPAAPKLVLMDPRTLVDYAKNNKKHSPDQIKRLAAAIRTTGFDQPIVVDRGMVIIKGHGRKLAAIEAGLAQVPVWVRDDLTPDQVDAARISDNVTISNDFDTRAMQEELQRLVNESASFSAEELGLTEKETKLLLSDLSEIVLDDMITGDTSEEIDRMKEEDAKNVRDNDGREIAIAKSLGFSKITRAEDRRITRALTIIEKKLSLDSKSALVAALEAQAAL